jgi:LytS/YehU family sensor histidine kinase
VFAVAHLPFWHVPWLALILYEIIKTTLFIALWLAFALGVKTFAAWQEQSRRLLEIQRALAEAHLAQLKQQLRPHFLFNTLNTISALMQTDVERADRLIARLADLLRVSMNVSERDLVPLETELRVLELYADIMRERFGDRVAVTWDIATAARQSAVPALMLQPLLENAFRHGVEACAGSQTITVRAQVEGSALALSVHNDGKLTDNAREGIGLTNCRRRLRTHYGERATLILVSDPSGVTSRVSLPLVAT